MSSLPLETIVRPFQLGTIFSGRVLPPIAPADVPPENIEAAYGGAVQLINKPIGITDLNSRSLHETDRQTSTVRVANPNDASQFVDVERIEQLHMKDDNGQSYTWRLNNG